MGEDMIHKAKITTNLGTFEFEGDRDFIDAQIEKIVGIAKSSPATTTPSPAENPATRSNGNLAKKTTQRKALVEQPRMLPKLITEGVKIEELRKFYALKSPETHIPRFAVLTHWLKNNCGLAEVSIDEMYTLYKILGLRQPKVLIQVFRDGKSKNAYFEVGTTPGHYYLTTFGETFVEHDLPRKIPTK